MSLKLDERVALVTGAARGLGRAEAIALARRGARVVAVDVLDASETVEEIERAGGTAVHARVDLTAGEAAAQEALDAALAAYGDLHVLVNNAGLMRDRMSFNLSAEDWDLVLAVNLSASFHLARAAARLWRERRAAGDAQPRAIVSTSSESGLYGNAGQANYSAAKAGVAALTITLATELDRYGVRVNAIAPRARTPMAGEAFGELPGGDDAHDPFGPEHIAEVVAWLVSDAAADVTGQVLVVHGGGIRVMQTWTPVREIPRD
ncbi:MAG TPA: SDR family NAD(P)-dependent oxidoreductase, partial [Conexibacter sp.]|nr:SDR family NAD(P)-dependent oxidoreductase [Conexibacter sp.]